jgi:hypothetical protein
MSRLPVNESSKGREVSATFTSVTTERNRLISWDSVAQGLKKPGGVTPSPKNSINIRTRGFVSKITKLFSPSIAKLSYTLFKLGYEIAKLFIRGISSVRRLLSGSKTAR